MTVRLRLTLWYTALLGITLILFSAAVYGAVSANLRAQMEQSAKNRAREMASVLADQLKLDVLIIRSAASNISFPDVELFASSVGIQVIDRTGQVIRRSVNIGDMTVPDYQRALAATNEGRDYVYYSEAPPDAMMIIYSTPLIVDEKVIGAVQVIQPVFAIMSALQQVSRYLILGTGIAMVLAALIGSLLARRALAPIDTITETADTIAASGDLGQRITIRDNASEVGRLAATFNNMLDRIQQLFQTQERLIGDVSHELRTPLTTIQGNIDLLQRMASVQTGSQQTGHLQELLRETLDEVGAESTRMNKMINDLLLLAQADSGALQFQMQSVEMDTLLLDVYRQTRQLAEHYKGAGSLDVRLGSEDQALVRGDRDRLRQVLLNMGENAVKYTPSGGKVTFSLEIEEGWVRISVIDTGIGISPENQQRIFERFYRTDKARSRELGGSGLGLSIAQRIATAHNGRITVESAPGAGSTFTLWLPALVSEREPGAEMAPSLAEIA
jgi:two-component system, OmpR family, sensor kinase